MMETCSSRFTAAEGGARLAAAAAMKNIVAVEYHSFIPVRLLCEKAFQIRGALSGGSQRSVYVTRATRIHVVAYELKILTDLDTICADSYDAVSDWSSELELKEVVICTAAVLQRILSEQLLTVGGINVLVIDSCHLIYTDDNLKYIMRQYKDCPLLNRPVILALTYPLFAAPKKESKKEVSLQNSQEIITIKCQEEMMKDKANEKELGVYVNVDDFDLYEMLEWKIEQLESELCCQMDLAEDIDVGKRVSSSQTKPRELIIEYGHRSSTDDVSEEYKDLESFMTQTIEDAMEFMTDHRHDPTEIYGEEMYEEFMNIPDPSVDPMIIFKQFLYILQQFGPYAADKAAFALLTKLEKLKVKVPYERHFLLLCLCTTVFVKIRGYADYVFSKVDDDWLRIKMFSTPKVLRFAEILESFNPPPTKNSNAGDSNKETDIDQCNINNRDDITKKMHNDIDKCDFTSLGNRIQDTINIYEANLKEINYYPSDICKNDSDNTNTTMGHDCGNDATTNPTLDDKDTNTNSDATSNVIEKGENNISDVAKSGIIDNKLPESFLRSLLPRRATHRARGRIRIPRNNIARMLMQQNPDTLCGIVYMKDALVAKIMFMIIVDMSRCNPRLSYLCAQYCATENPANPETELKECQRQGKKQEEVLKKFRMHECNLLLATSALEEGIDLPRCNLVLRWDVPSSYRSYGLCRDRARAPRATAALLCSYSTETTESLLHNIATYRELDQVIGRKCGCGVQDEPAQEEEDHADRLNSFISPYTPKGGNGMEIYEHTDINELKSRGIINDTAKTKIIDSNNQDVSNIADSDDTLLNVDNVESKKDNTHNLNNYKTEDKFDIMDGNRDTVEQNMDSENCKRLINNISESNNRNESHKYEAKTNVKAKKNLLNALDSSVNINIDKISQSDNIYDDNLFVNAKNIKNIEDNMDEMKIDNCVHQNGWDISYLDQKTHMGNDSVYNAKSEINILTSVINEHAKQKIHESNDFKTNINIPIPVIAKEEKEIKNMSKLEGYVHDIKENVYCNKCCVKINECSCVPKGNDVIKNDISTDDAKKPLTGNDNASVDLNTAITFINRYCGKLPSDTFTRLAPQWWMETVQIAHKDTKEMKTAYICTLRLPLNCPVKYNIVGHPMPTRVLARRMVALQACRILHKSGELDNQLMPIGKENFNMVGQDLSNNTGAEAPDNSESARPGTTKRRQYYYKRTAWAFTDCQPVIDTRDSDIDSCEQENEIGTEDSLENPTGTKRNMLYAIVSSLWCALPERYNTRGRRLHAPQNASQAIGILMAREEPDNLQIPAFPVYTRSGEVRVSVEYVPDADVRLSPKRERLVRRFMHFVFAEVLRVRRKGMGLEDEGSTHNNYYIVPTIKSSRSDGTTKIDIDWTFLQLIYDHTECKSTACVESALLWEKTEDEEVDKETKVSVRERRNKVKNMENPLLKQGEVFVFDPDKYKEAVVTPWYRNQDQPQFFLVAEICWNLTPESSFPSVSHASFRDYYTCKYGVTLTQKQQPLLDVDHTSARLNLLTPRYVNRKGVALPVSSERTRRAKRDRLDQKQILVPELCRVHPFAAPLWFATVALPCVLYRINALLIADEIRRSVAIDVGLGIPKINEQTMPGFQWPALDFGWSLAEVLNADFEKNEKKREEEEMKKEQRDKELRERDDKKEKEIEDEKEVEQECKEKTINDILQEKEEAAGSFEIGTWSNDMAAEIPEDLEYDEFLEPLPPNLTFCTSASGGKNWCDPIEKPKFTSHAHNKMYSMVDSDCSYMSSDLDSDDTDLDYEGSEDDADNGFCCNKNTNMAMGVRIEYKTAHEAEAVDLERTKKVTPAPVPDEADDIIDREEHEKMLKTGVAPKEYVERFRASVVKHKLEIVENGNLIRKDKCLGDILPEHNNKQLRPVDMSADGGISELFPYGTEALVLRNGQVDIASIERNKRIIMEGIKKTLPKEELSKLNCFSMKDIDIDSPEYVNEKLVNVGFDKKESYKEMCRGNDKFAPYYVEGKEKGVKFDFDYQPKLEGHPGPSPSVILQALTMSNANDGINLERLETIGDSFLKFAITAYLYCAHPTVHEGKLSHMRSKQVSNLNLYRLGRNKRLGARMIASKFEPHDNWLPPCHRPPPTLQPGSQGDINIEPLNSEMPLDATGCFIPYNLITQHSIPDKSIADCVEALIGAYLLECGPRGALLFMSWLGIKVLPCHHVELESEHPYVVAASNTCRQENIPSLPVSPKRCGSTSSSECSSDEDSQQLDMFPDLDWSWPGRAVGSLRPYVDHRGVWMQPVFGELKAPPSPLLRYIADPEGELEQMLSGYDALERTLQYRFKDRSLLLQALTHASHHSNRLTDCYQRLEFLGDAILDYLITRHLYEDPRRHSPGALTDLRSALVNNTIFATLAARHGFHKYFRHMSPGLNEVLTKYVKIQEENGHSISEEHYLIQEDEMEQAEDVEVPKALGDLFESVAGAIFLDSGMSLAAVWKSYVNLMGAELEAFSAAAPKSPVRELLEAEPDTAKFGKPERLADGRRVRVCVEVFGRGTFKGIGRNHRIAKGTAARCALRHLRIHKGH